MPNVRRIHPAPFLVPAALLLAGIQCGSSDLVAQTDFYNLDRDRPLRVEDAYSTKRWAFEVQASPFNLSQDRAGELAYQPALELKHGLFPGVELSAGLGWDLRRLGSNATSTLSDLEFSALANLWVEGERLPAAALRVTTHVPTDSDDAGHSEIRGVLTRSVAGPVRVHLNGAAVVGEGRGEEWWAGMALDWVLPFRHTLLLAESWIAEPVSGERRVHSGLGLRIQISPTLVLDAGAGRSWAGATRQDWAATLGVTHEFGVRRLMPGVGR